MKQPKAPAKPSKPVIKGPPEKRIKRTRVENLRELPEYETFTLDSLKNDLARVGAGEDALLEVRLMETGDSYDPPVATLVVHTFEEIDNPNYEYELKQHEAEKAKLAPRLEKYEADMVKYKEKKEKYDVDKKAYDEHVRQTQIARLEKELSKLKGKS